MDDYRLNDEREAVIGCERESMNYERSVGKEMKIERKERNMKKNKR